MNNPCNPLIDYCGHANIFFRPFSFPDFPNIDPIGDDGVELEDSLFLIELEDSTDLIIKE